MFGLTNTLLPCQLRGKVAKISSTSCCNEASYEASAQKTRGFDESNDGFTVPSSQFTVKKKEMPSLHRTVVKNR
jgi:RecG-like helicase